MALYYKIGAKLSSLNIPVHSVLKTKLKLDEAFNLELFHAFYYIGKASKYGLAPNLTISVQSWAKLCNLVSETHDKNNIEKYIDDDNIIISLS